MFNNLFNQIIVVMIGVISLTNTYANIEYFTSAAPSIYGEVRSKRIGIRNNNEFYVKNTSYDINEINQNNRGIGYIEGKIDPEIYKQYMLNLHNFEKYSKLVDSNPLKGNKLNVVYQKNDKKIVRSIPFNFFVKNSEAKLIKNWFDRRANVISNSENHNIKAGFFVDYIPISMEENFLKFKISFVNNGNVDVRILDIKEWKKNQSERYKQYGVRLYLKSDYDFFNYYLTEDNVINIEKYKDGLIIPKGGFLDLEFKIEEEKFSDFLKFKKNNVGRDFVSYVNIELSVISPILINGGFIYETEHYKF